MGAEPARVPDLGSVLELLERAVGYTRISLHRLSRAELRAPTPCAGWDLLRLLAHMSDSLAALQEAAHGAGVSTSGTPPDGPDIAARLREQACALLGAWTRDGDAGLVAIGGRSLDARVLVATGALEITVHGWDVARARCITHPIPDELATALHGFVPLLVCPADRPHRFGPPVPMRPDAPAGRRLLGVLGRIG